MIDGRHEAASVHMANAYSRILRKPGVVMSTTPGHANAVAGLANAMHSEAPVINIAGSADSSNIGRGAMEAIGRQPDAYGKIQTAMLIAAALVEGIGFAALFAV